MRDAGKQGSGRLLIGRIGWRYAGTGYNGRIAAADCSCSVLASVLPFSFSFHHPLQFNAISRQHISSTPPTATTNPPYLVPDIPPLSGLFLSHFRLTGRDTLAQMIDFPSPILSVASDVVKELDGQDALRGMWTGTSPSLSFFPATHHLDGVSQSLQNASPT